MKKLYQALGIRHQALAAIKPFLLPIAHSLSTIGFLLLPIAYSLSPFPAYAQCKTFNKNGGCATIDTAIGQLSTNPADLVNSLLRILLSLSGGIAVLLIIASGYQMAVSQGNPEKVKEARERLTSAIIGLLFTIFSVTILQIIGIDILHIPGFGPSR